MTDDSPPGDRGTVAGFRAARRARRFGFVAAALAFGAVFGLAALEVAMRASGIAPPLPHGGFVTDSVLPWKMDADWEGRDRTDEFDVRYTHNSLGFRGRDHPFEKPPGAFRIVGIGDSFTYGIGVDDDATFLARIEAALDGRSARRVEAINSPWKKRPALRSSTGGRQVPVRFRGGALFPPAGGANRCAIPPAIFRGEGDTPSPRPSPVGASRRRTLPGLHRLSTSGYRATGPTPKPWCLNTTAWSSGPTS